MDGAAFGKSIHGPLACTDCHADLATAELPHAEKLAAVDCSTCHADAVAAYGKGVHAEARHAGQNLAATCVDCHTRHAIRGAKDPESSTYPLNLPQTCGRCHGDKKVIAEAKIEVGDVFSKYLDSIHGKVLEKSGLLVAPSCGTCHGNHEIRRKTDPASRVWRGNVPTTCGSCHEGIKLQYVESVHGAKLAAGDPRVPTCATCHTAHSIRRVDAEPWKLDVLTECGSCHAESLRTYRDTFHGQVTSLGFSRVATCADCHGSHRIQPKSDPRSTVSAAHRTETCRKCHPRANDNFAAYDPHADKHDRDRNGMLYFSARFMEFLLVGVFSFFGLHTALWFTRLLRKDARPPHSAHGPKA